MNKYKSQEVVVDGIKFDSKDESEFYKYLKILKTQGKIKDFELQPKYKLIPAFKKGDKSYRALTYTPDFKIYHNDGSEELIDVKGYSTQQGELRKKLFDFKYPHIKLTWVARSLKYGENGWIEYSKLQKVRKENKKHAVR